MAARTYLPTLDGVRAIAIAAVVAYHLGYLSGGWIGVDVFFVLSGYLITSILLDHAAKWGQLGPFWGRRVRRLLPAVLALLVALSLYSWAAGPGLVPAQFRTPALATLFYSANWQEIAAGHSYFAQFVSPSPLQHTWSLAIEEQYYVAWPLVLGTLVWATRRMDGRKRQQTLILATLVMAVASAIWMGMAAHLFGPDRAYLGTDTRAWELLLGGLLAMAWPASSPSRPGPRWGAAAVIGTAGLVAGALSAGGPPAWIWAGGLVALGMSAGLLIVGSVQAPRGAIARTLSLGPMRWLGKISYSLYLWHWPVIVLITPESSGLSGLSLLAARMSTMLVASTSSYYLVERPLRGLDWSGLAQRIRFPTPSFVAGGVVTTAVAIIVATTGPALASSAPVVLSTSPSPSTGAPLDLTPASAGDPYRVWIIGDSVMADASPGIQAALQATGNVSVVANSAAGGWGITTDAEWPADAQRIVTADRPQIVIGTWSWDDNAAAADEQSYLNRLEMALRRLLVPSTGIEAVVLIQFPQLGPETEVINKPEITAGWLQTVQSQNAWDSVASKAVGAFPGRALYLSTDQLFAPGGRFFTWMRTASGSWLRARKLDNDHFCPYGAAEFGALLVQDLTPELHLAPMKPGWEVGPWARDHRFDEPPGACPDDHPPPSYNGVPIPTAQVR
jgi:peptidoglycan/LPS O-acetylase OafA/YrhL